MTLPRAVGEDDLSSRDVGKKTITLPGIRTPVKVKKHCCRSRPRCTGCPVVVMRLQRLDTDGMSDKKVRRAVKKARAA